MEAFQESAGGVTYYKHLPRLYSELTAYGQKDRAMPAPHDYYTRERLAAFLADEIATCAPTSSEVP
jgi:hypothetical protein